MINALKFLGLITINISLMMAALPATAASSFKSIITDSSKTISARDRALYNPKTATRLALIPGMGQIYNRDLWKIPIVYASLGASLFAIHLNSMKYHDFLRAYLAFYDLRTGHLGQGVTDNTRLPVVVRSLLNTSSTVELLTRDQIERNKNVRCGGIGISRF